MKNLRVRYLIAISFVGILSACGGEDTVSSEVAPQLKLVLRYRALWLRFRHNKSKR